MTDAAVRQRAPIESRVRITEIFRSLQGEGSSTGFPTVFVRLTGCPLRCNYCDTAYAFSGGQMRQVNDVVEEVVGLNTRYVCVTGGEPLAQKSCWPLMRRLCDEGMSVSLETSGAISTQNVDPRVCVVLDLKTPSSGEQRRNDLSNLERLRAQDQVKFVVADRADFDWTIEMVRRHRLDERAIVLISPSHGVLAPVTLADWVLQSDLNIKLQVQLHKVLWGDEPGR